MDQIRASIPTVFWSFLISRPRHMKASRRYGVKTRFGLPIGELPGMMWIHEESDEGRPQTPEGVKEFRRLIGLRPNEARNGEQQASLSNPESPEPQTTSCFDNNCTSSDLSPIPDEVETFIDITTRCTYRRSRSLHAGRLTTEDPQSLEESVSRTLRSVHSSKVEKRKEPNPNIPKRYLRKKSARSIEHHETPSKPRQDSSLLEPQKHNSENDDDANSVSLHRRTSSRRSIRRSRLFALGLVEPARVSSPRSQLQRERAIDGRSNFVISRLSPGRAINGTGVENHSPAKVQPRVTTGTVRRSLGIAEQRQKKRRKL